MKFKCSQSMLAKALNIVSKAVTSRTTIPILKGILLEVSENGTLKMSACSASYQRLHRDFLHKPIQKYFSKEECLADLLKTLQQAALYIGQTKQAQE